MAKEEKEHADKTKCWQRNKLKDCLVRMLVGCLLLGSADDLNANVNILDRYFPLSIQDIPHSPLSGSLFFDYPESPLVEQKRKGDHEERKGDRPYNHMVAPEAGNCISRQYKVLLEEVFLVPLQKRAK